jgi:hypothetical protein
MWVFRAYGRGLDWETMNTKLCFEQGSIGAYDCATGENFLFI